MDLPFPKIKKKLNVFLMNENGKIKKSAVLGAGVILFLNAVQMVVGHSSHDHHNSSYYPHKICCGSGSCHDNRLDAGSGARGKHYNCWQIHSSHESY